MKSRSRIQKSGARTKEPGEKLYRSSGVSVYRDESQAKDHGDTRANLEHETRNPEPEERQR